MLQRSARAARAAFRALSSASANGALRAGAAGAASAHAAPAHAARALTPVRCDDGTLVTPYAAPTRAEQMRRLEAEEFDLVVVGGGCVGERAGGRGRARRARAARAPLTFNGAASSPPPPLGVGVAWEAATRGLRVALVERDDFASGTSGRSTKLIHGGIRYLESAFKNLDVSMLALVKEALEERAHLLNAAPYMAHALATLIPIYTWWEIPYMWAGTKVYDLVAGAHRFVPASYYISAEEARQQFPMLAADGLKGGIVYYDGAHNDSRMNLMIALTAAQAGAAVANYVSVTGVLKDARGAAAGVAVRDEQTGRAFNVRAKAVVNATGPFGDALRALDDPATPPLILGAAGVHVILPDHFSPDRMGLIVPKTSDGRVLFLLPWEGSTLAGTTDAPADITMSPRATEDDINFIINEASRFLKVPIKRADVKAAWSGIRPLVKDPAKLAAGKGSSQLTRSHIVDTSKSGMVSVLGGKWTTYRRMAQDAVDAVAKLPGLPPVGKSVTQHMQLLGADRAGVVVHRRYDRIAITLRETYGLPKDVAKHLMSNYGTRALQLAELAKAAPALAARVSTRHPFILAEVVFAVEHEYARAAVDVLARRMRLAFLNAADAADAAPLVIATMAPLLGWSDAEQKAQAAAVDAYLLGMK